VTTSHLPRRAIVGTVLATALMGGGLVAAFAGDEAGGLGLPTAGCNTVADAKGDGSTGSQEGLPGGAPNDPDLDITGVVFGSSPTAITSVIRVDKLGSAPSPGVGHYWIVDFSAAGKAVEFASNRLVEPLQTVYSQALLPDVVRIGGTTDKTIKLTATYDTKNSLIILSADRPALEKALGAPLAGTSLTKLHIESGFHVVTGYETADVAEGKADEPFTVGSNTCFGAGSAPAAVPSAAPSASPSAEPTPAPSAAPPAAGGPSAGGAPLANCFTTKDPAGDAWYPASVVPNDTDLDLLGVTLGTNNDALVAYFKVAKLANGPATLDGHRFTLNFTFNKHAFAAAGSAFKDAQAAQIRDGAASTGRFGHLTQLSMDGSSIPPSSPEGAQTVATGSAYVASGLKYTFDTKTSTVSLSLPLADIAKYGKAPITAATLTGVYVTAATDTGLLSSSWDIAPDGASASAPGKVTYSIGDNACFGAAAPAASPLTNVGAVRAQYGDVAAVAAKLVDAAGAAVAGKTVTFTLGSSTATGVTGADGVAKASLTVKDKAGKRSLGLSSDEAKTSVVFTVLVEKTALKAVGNKGTVTATLTDDDKKAVVGQVITFASGSKKVTAKTDAKGIAKGSGLPSGNIKVSYAGETGMYTAASTTTKA
jgi:hypothetical protein